MIEIYRTLKIPDPESVTAKNTLRRDHENLVEVDRLEQFIIDTDRRSLKSVIDYLVNPNKHSYMAIVNREVQGDEDRFRKKYNTKILVETEDDPVVNDAYVVLRERYGLNIQAVRRKVIWGLNFSGLKRNEIPLEVNEMIGFFANPVFQRYEIIL